MQLSPFLILRKINKSAVTLSKAQAHSQPALFCVWSPHALIIEKSAISNSFLQVLKV